MADNVFLSVVIPVYKCQGCLQELYSRLEKVLTVITDNFEIIMVDDRSPDQSWMVIEALARQDARVKGVRLSRNFGQHYAITAGLQFVKGDWCVIMDCDLQDVPEEIPKLYNKAQEGYDLVVGCREFRQDNFLKKFTSWFFYKIFNFLTDQDLDNNVANFGIYSKRVIDAIKLYGEHDRSVGLIASIVGFNKKVIPVRHASRITGATSYSLRMRLRMAEDHILSHSVKPLKMVLYSGFMLSAASVSYAIFLIIKFFFYSIPVAGWLTLAVALFLLSGIIMSIIGIVGLYVGRIYIEVRARPLYIIDKMTFTEDSCSGSNLYNV